jgi:CO/xanthine dehydrogenase Mo-binding subunit
VSLEVGRRVPRKEDRRLLLGHGRFGADVELPRATHARVVRSPAASGRLL